jgi:transposase
MLSLGANVRVYLCAEAVDMRRSFDGLSVLAQEVLAQDPLSGHLLVFHNRRKDKLKVLYYDGQGLCLWYKRLEQGCFCIPPAAGEALELDARELALLLEGLDVALAEQAPRRAILAVA